MKKNYLIGIGGTGARVIESAVYLCAAGYGPEELKIFLIDPDSGNGNLNNTKTVIKRYQECRKRLGALADRKNGGRIFTTRIEIPSDDGLVWGVFSSDTKSGQATALKQMIGYPEMQTQAKGLSQLVDLLFTQEELKSELTEGFRGHPSIGALTMSAAMSDEKVFETEPWKSFFKDLESLTGGPSEMGVFLVGSIFGGTGAAGVPTFAHKKTLKEHDKAKLGENKSRIALGGALVLPYFSYEKDPKKEQAEASAGKIFAKVEEFALATKAALSFYSEKKLGFDQIYFIGDSSSYSVGNFATGQGAQKNNPHYIEMITALASFDFYDQPISAEKPLESPMHFIASRKDNAITWDSFPVGRDSTDIGKQGDLKKKLISMTALSYSYLTYGLSILKEPKGPEAMNATWRNQLFGRGIRDTEKDIFYDTNQGDLERYFTPFFKNYIYWLGSISDLHESGSTEPSNDIRLLVNKLISAEDMADGSDPKKPLPFFGGKDTKIGNLIKESSNSMDMDTYVAKYITGAIATIANKDQKGPIEKMIELFCSASYSFCNDNYTIKK